MSGDLSAAVEAGARAWFDRGQAQRRDAGAFREDGQRWKWGDLGALDQHAFREVVLPVVEAAVEAWEAS